MTVAVEEEKQLKLLDGFISSTLKERKKEERTVKECEMRVRFFAEGFVSDRICNNVKVG